MVIIKCAPAAGAGRPDSLPGILEVSINTKSPFRGFLFGCNKFINLLPILNNRVGRFMVHVMTMFYQDTV
jgi:hypothetical protein